MNQKEKGLSLLKTGTLYGLTLGKNALLEGQILLDAGVTWLQYRVKNQPYKKMLAEASRLQRNAKEKKALFIINDHLDLALELDADGLHLGQEDGNVMAARRALGKDKILGLSTHNKEELKDALCLPIDYIGAGPLFTSGTKPDREVAGLAYAAHAVQNCTLPIVGIGGVTKKNLHLVKATGLKTVGVLGAIFEAKVPQQSAQEFLNLLENEAFFVD